MRCLMFLKALTRARRGAVTTIVAIVFPVAVGTVGLVAEYGRGVLVKVQNQRIADLGAYAGAVAYNATTSQTSMVDAAKAVGVLNGIPAANVTATLVASPSGVAGTNAVKVVVATSVPLILSRLIQAGASLPVSSEAYAELNPGQDSCILALSGSSTGVTLSGGTTVTAAACVVASNASAAVPCGTYIRSPGLNYNTVAPTVGCGGITNASGGAATIVKKASVDQVASNPDLATARGRLTTAGAVTGPTVAAGPAAPAAPVVTTPTGPFNAITFDIYTNGGATTRSQATTLGCTATNASTAWTFNCPAGSHKISTLSVAGGQTLTFAGTASTNYVFSLNPNTGAALNFGTGNFTFMSGLTIGYGGATFGPGSLTVIGAMSTGASGGNTSFASGNVTITGNAGFTATTSFTGTGTFQVGGTLTTNATTGIAQANVTVTGTTLLQSATTLSGTGTLWVGGNLTTAGNPVIATSTMKVTGALAVTSAVNFNNLTTLSVGGLTTIGSSGTMAFAGGTYTLTGGLQTSGSTVITIGAGTYAVGRMASNCGSFPYSICSSAASMIISGPSSFLLDGGISVTGGSTVTLGTGTGANVGNSFKIGKSTSGDAITVGGGAKFSMGDATGVSSVFELGGNFNIASGGGSCTFISAAVQHDINGSIVTAGATILGSGTYTVYGSVGIGANGGGNVTCNGTSYGLSADTVSLIIGANGAALTGTCAGQAFCVAAGYSSVTLIAPTAGTYKKMAVIGPASGASGAFFTQGSSGTSLSGLVYFPTGPVRLDGAASVGNGASQCLQLIGRDITLNGGSVLASTCISGNSSGGKVVLVK